MSELSNIATLKEVAAYKKKLNWGEIPAIFQLACSSISDLDGILTHGFDSAFKQILNPSSWNWDLLGAYKDNQGNIHVENKPQIVLHHIFDEKNYELHCVPVVDGQEVYSCLLKDPNCPFANWYPETMQMLFRVNTLVPFIAYGLQRGDQADIALIKFSHRRVKEHIEILNESFDIVAIKGHDIAEFCQELHQRSAQMHANDAFDH